MKRSGTLFSYFQPSENCTPNKKPTENGRQKTPRSTPKASAPPRPKSKTSPPSLSSQKGKKTPRASSTVLIGGSKQPAKGTLVWAKMEGHPWWPGVVCPHPSSGKLSRGRKAPEVHVQFFGKPPTRGWVTAANTELLNKATVGGHSESEVGWSEAVQECRGALEMTEEERSKLIVDIPSEAEEEEWSGEECNGGGVELMDSTPSGRKRPPPISSDEEDSERDIGVRKNLLGRPKRTAAMSVGERSRVKKRARRVLDSDNSEDEYCPVGGDSVSSDECSSGVEEVESDATPSSENERDNIITPAKKRKVSTNSTAKTPQTPASTKNQASNGHLFNSPSVSPAPATPTLSQSGPFKHENLDWLKEKNRKDKKGRAMNDPDYNPRTIAIPRQYLKSLTPAMRQWWEIKADNFDTILMFKVGKFYELYHMDAVTGVKELGLVFMKGVFAHSGFPEVAFGRYAQTLVQKGYKVARVEQTETPQMMEERVKKIMGPTRFDRVVRRELCSVMTKGTRTLGFFDGEITDCEASYLMAVKEKPLQSSGQSEYGVCFVDTSIGKFHLGQFSDDRQCSRLRTLVAHHPPAHVLYERGNLSAKTMQVVNQLLSTAIRDCLSPNSEFWDANKTLKVLAEGSYFTSEGEGEFQWPDSLKMMLAEDDSLGLTAGDSYELAISALGACVWCLKRCCIDQELLMMKSIECYEPVDAVSIPTPTTEAGNQFAGQRMVLDDITLSNLDVMDNHGQTAGTLLERIDHCATPFGKRLLKQWLCSPLCHPQAINERLDAVVDLMDNPSLVGGVKEVLRTLPDLERLLRKIQTMGSTARVKDHPDGRAIFYEQTVYSKRKITDFIVVLEGLRASLKIGELCSELANTLNSQLLKKITLLSSKGGHYPDLRELLDYFQRSFDHEKARKQGVILPAKGVNLSYDSALRDITQKERDLEEYLQRQRKRLGCRTIVYWGNGRNRYQLEVPEAVLSRHTPDEYDLKSQKKGFRRYWTPEIESMLEELVDAEERRDVALKDNMRALFHSFSEHFKLWESAVQCLAVLDVLVSLSVYSSGGEGVMCRPRLTASALPFLDLRAGRHPCITRTFTGDDFIPNDVTINPEAAPDGSLCVVVTGPNMGGKSTLLRQTGLIIILAQLGCFVPAESCRLSPVDRVFTRLGASDRIMSGESTFFVELSETSTILQHSTQHSLVLLDELGRGTATYDGTAIACAVVRELAEKTKCRTLFSTHYHSLVEEFAGKPCIALGHMACMVEDEVEGEAEGEETITFLYKFVEGACPKSYGFNAAKLAGIPNEVIHVARKKAQDFEKLTELQRLFRRLMSPDFEVDSLPQACQEMSSLL